MNKWIFALAFSASALLATDDIEATKKEIQEAQAQIKVLNAKIKRLKESMPADTTLITHTEFGYSRTGGNTDTQDMNLETTLKKRWGKHQALLHVDAQYGKSDGVESKNKIFAELGYNYLFAKKTSFTYIAGYKNDKFSDYNYQFYTGPGLKYNALKTEKQILDIESSILYSQDDKKGSSNARQYASYLLRGIYAWQILDNLRFAQDLGYRASTDDYSNYFLNSKSALTSKLTDIFSAGLSYKVDYANKIKRPVKHADNTLTLNLIADY